MSRSPTARSLEALRRDGWTVAVAERWIPQAGIRRDLFGMFDIVAIRTDQAGVLGVQATSASNHAARVTKVRENPALAIWLAAGNGAQVWSWGQDPNGRWVCRKEALTLTEGVVVPARLTPRSRPRRHRRGERQQQLFPVEEDG